MAALSEAHDFRKDGVAQVGCGIPLQLDLELSAALAQSSGHLLEHRETLGEERAKSNTIPTGPSRRNTIPEPASKT